MPHTRRSIRLKDYDYSQAGAYFVTICVQNRECLLGEIVNDEMRANNLGKIVADCWGAIPKHFPHVELDAFVVMPNHIHGIILITKRRGTACRTPTFEQFGKPISGSLPTVIRSFKSATTKQINETRHIPGTSFWQSNYPEHIIRNETDLARIQRYILDNPLQWALDSENRSINYDNKTRPRLPTN